MIYAIAAIALGVVALVIYLLSFGKKAGQSKVVADVATHTVKVQSDMAEAQVNAPTGKPEIVKRLREKGL